MSLYHIVLMGPARSTTPCPEYGVFQDGKEASAFAAGLTQTYPGSKFQSRVFKSREDWRKREATRLADGTYTPLPWANELPLIPDHFAHIGVKDPTTVAFTPTSDYGEKDRQITHPVTRYLVDNYPELSIHDRRVIELIHLGKDEDQKVQFASTRDAIRKVYRNGPHSCMTYSSDHFPTPDHPVEYYAAGDLAVAYITEGKDIIARTITWPDKKIFGRVYDHDEGNGEASTLLKLALIKEGYEYDFLGFRGAKLLKEWVDDVEFEDDSFTGYAVPYLDFYPGVSDTEDPNHLVVSSDGLFVANSPGGVAEKQREALYRCVECEVHRVDDSRDRERKLCLDCMIKHGRACAISGYTFYAHTPEKRTSRYGVQLADGKAVNTPYRASHTFVCPHTGERWLKRDGIMVNSQLCSPNYKVDQSDQRTD